MAPDITSVYPWTQSPLVINAPMRLIALAPLAVAVSQAGGLGFLGAGTDVRELKNEVQRAADLLRQSPIISLDTGVLPIGVGFINWALDLETVLEAFRDHIPAAVWFFAPKRNEDLARWTHEIRSFSNGKTQIWIQIGSVADAVEVTELSSPDCIVVQGADAGGHGLVQGAGIISLLPEVADALEGMGRGGIPLIAAGGIVEGRSAAAGLAMGASGVALGTLFLASKEANIAKGYQNDILRTVDGGLTTVRTSVYDMLRGTTGWPNKYNGRGIINDSFTDSQKGKPLNDNKSLYEEALQKGDHGWGDNGRLTAYAGSGVGLVKEVLPARLIVERIRQESNMAISRLAKSTSKL